MERLRLLWVLVLTFSTFKKVHVRTIVNSPTVWSHNHDSSSKEAKMESPQCPLPLLIQDQQQRSKSTCTDERGNKISVSENQTNFSIAAVMDGFVNTILKEEVKQKKYLRILESYNTRQVSMSSAHDESLRHMLLAVVKAELRDCDLVVAYDTGYSEHAVLQDLLLLHNTRQVVDLRTTDDLARIVWTSSKCRGYFFLLDDPEPLLTFCKTDHDAWDYSGRFVLVLPSLHYLEAFIATDIGERTENIVGMVKSGTEGEWALYMNLLFWGPGARRINTWYRNRFTRQVELFPDKLSDFQGAVIKVTSFHYEPCNFFHRAENGTILHHYSMDIEVVRTIAHILNITLEFSETPNGETWGEMYPNGSWYGVMGQLQRHKADIGLACLFITSHWSQVIQLSAPYLTESMSFMARVEPPLPHWQAVAFPFHQWTWLAIGIGLIFSGPTLFLLAQGSGQCGGEIKNLQSLSFAWYYAFGLHFCEAHKSLPRNPCTQIYIQFLWLYTMILTNVYSANLKSFLLVKKQPTMMETFEDLYESEVEIAAVTELFKFELALSTNPYLQGLARAYKYYEFVEDIYPPMLAGETVYLGNRLSLDYLLKIRFTKRRVSRVRILKEFYGAYNVGVGLQKRSALRRKFDKLMYRIQQSGLVRKFITDSLRLHVTLNKDVGHDDDSDSGHEQAGGGVTPLSLDSVQGLFLITLCGWLCGSLSFVVEKTILSR